MTDPTEDMIAAGCEAFKRTRRVLDDLYDCFDCDMEMFVVEIYKAMEQRKCGK